MNDKSLLPWQEEDNIERTYRLGKNIGRRPTGEFLMEYIGARIRFSQASLRNVLQVFATVNG